MTRQPRFPGRRALTLSAALIGSLALAAGGTPAAGAGGANPPCDSAGHSVRPGPGCLPTSSAPAKRKRAPKTGTKRKRTPKTGSKRKRTPKTGSKRKRTPKKVAPKTAKPPKKAPPKRLPPKRLPPKMVQPTS